MKKLEDITLYEYSAFFELKQILNFLINEGEDFHHCDFIQFMEKKAELIHILEVCLNRITLSQ